MKVIQLFTYSHLLLLLFQTKFERFFLEHAETFEDDEEHKLIYHDIYLEFQNMFDGELEHFCEMNGITRSE